MYYDSEKKWSSKVYDTSGHGVPDTRRRLNTILPVNEEYDIYEVGGVGMFINNPVNPSGIAIPLGIIDKMYYSILRTFTEEQLSAPLFQL